LKIYNPKGLLSDMDSNKNQLNQISHSTNPAAEILIADSQINADLSKVKPNDLPHHFTSTCSNMDQNIENSEKLTFTHKKNFGNLDLAKMNDNEKIFREIEDVVIETNFIHAGNFSNKNILRNENIEISQERDDLMIQSSFVDSKNSLEKGLKIIKDTEVSLGVRSENDCSVLVTPLVQTSVPSSPEYSEGLSRVLIASLTSLFPLVL
jgi:hypothetical protein